MIKIDEKVWVNPLHIVDIYSSTTYKDGIKQDPITKITTSNGESLDVTSMSKDSLADIISHKLGYHNK